jgi:exosome complex RNA-binding protein Csl4
MDAKILQTDFDQATDQEDFNQALDNLVDGGHIYALCPACLIPLDKTERQKHSCNVCGPFDIRQVKFKYNDSHKC